jgi:hypothetical protein
MKGGANCPKRAKLRMKEDYVFEETIFEGSNYL